MSPAYLLLDELGTSSTVLSRGASAWSADLVAYVLDSLEHFQGEYTLQPGSLCVSKKAWWKAFVLASRDSGLTRPKLCGIHRKQIAANGVAVVRVGESDEIIRFRRDTLATMLDHETPFAFPFSKKIFWREWKAFCSEARLPKSLRVCRIAQKPSPPILTQDSATGHDTHEPPETLSVFLEQLYIPLRLRGKSERTVKLYRFSVRIFSTWMGRSAKLSDLNDLTVANYLASLAETHKPHTVEKERCQLLAMWRLANDYHFITKPPNIPPTPLPHRDPVCWTESELRRLFNAAKRERGNYAGIPAGDWWTALLMVIWDTGERIDAVLSLTWDDFDLEQRWVRIPAEYRKGRTSDKTHRLHVDTIDALRAIRLTCDEHVFPWPYNKGYLWHVFGLILAAAHLPNDSKRKFHCLRRSVASHFEAAGGNATFLLGHSSRSVTEKSYLDPRVVRSQQAAETLFRPYELQEQNS